MTFPFFKCWKDDQAEDAAKVLSACDAEQAAQEFADQWLRDDPERGTRFVDGDPLVVLVRDDGERANGWFGLHGIVERLFDKFVVDRTSLAWPAKVREIAEWMGGGA